MEKMDDLSELINTSINKRIDKLLLKDLQVLCKELGVDVFKKNKKNKEINKTKRELIDDAKVIWTTLTTQQKINIMKKEKLGFELEVKNLLAHNINIDCLVETNVCLTLATFLEENPVLQNSFTNSCDLVNINNNIKSSNCNPNEMQGLYILTIGKNGIDYVVKLGSFAESQGMSKRICSFGGGNCETGSLTNKWFQRFIKQAISLGYTSKFVYYNKIQEKILITNLDSEQIEMMPYVMRPLETELFKKYNNSNGNISPIFGSNCL